MLVSKLDTSILKSPYVYIDITWILIFIYVTQNIELGLPFQLLFQPHTTTFPVLLVIIFCVSMIVPLHEELFFRGILFTYLEKKNLFAAFFIPSMIFSLIHINMPISSFIMSLSFSYLFWKYKSILVPFLAHSLWNLIVTFII
ncbi:CPBP family intramembrane glutamic endopeptidase [Bacillus infantis]|uniref:CPBP family intramembrane glutamic endopeptidase n=1 Tax=Bacillus infantis TaxID=324767 RepID=UPI002E89A357|nr:CPBP family intramembrane metalloprotease [Bacillus infantis]